MENKYLRAIRPADGVGEPILVDIYEVILAFGVTCPARQHAIKKLLCAGLRSKGNTLQDLKEVIQSTQRAIEIVERNQESTHFETRSIELPVKLSPEMVEELKQDKERAAARCEELNREWEQYCKEQEEKWNFGETKAPQGIFNQLATMKQSEAPAPLGEIKAPFHPATCLHQRVTQYSNDIGTIEHCRDCGMVRNVEIKLPTKEQTNG